MGVILLLQQVLSLYMVVIVIRALVSWVSPDPRNPIVQALHRITEPVLAPLRSLVPPQVFGGLDVSPILAIVLISLLNGLIGAAAY